LPLGPKDAWWRAGLEIGAFYHQLAIGFAPSLPPEGKAVAGESLLGVGSWTNRAPRPRIPPIPARSRRCESQDEKNGQYLPLDRSAPLCHYPAMLGDTQEPVLPHPRIAKYWRVHEKQFPERQGEVLLLRG